MRVYAKDILRDLRELQGPHRLHVILTDWIDLSQRTMASLPAHLKAAQSGELHRDDEETARAFERARERHGDRMQQVFGRALGRLIAEAEMHQDAPEDLLGPIYMEVSADGFLGQYFTPPHLCEAMARMTITDGERMVHDRVKSALMSDPLGQALVLAGAILDDPEAAREHFFRRLLPVAALHLDPITLCDPCCGSGATLLAGLAQFPAWARHLGFVQMFGQDIDGHCVSMAKLQSSLYLCRGSVASPESVRAYADLALGSSPTHREPDVEATSVGGATSGDGLAGPSVTLSAPAPAPTRYEAVRQLVLFGS